MKQKKAILIGIDGFDPSILEEMMGGGLLPNFSRLADKGYYSPLETVNPPQSPVVWTSIATGCNPGEHGIYDFLERTAGDYQPRLSVTRLEKSRFVPPVKIKTFWETASDKQVKSVVLRWPLTFPAKSFNGMLLSGLGVPDIKGTLGVYTLFTSGENMAGNDPKGRIEKVEIRDNRIRAEIRGPLLFSLTGRKESAIPLVIELSNDKIRFSLKNTYYELKEGSWSEWINLKFNVGFRKSVTGMCKFYLKSVSPTFNLYVSPINIPTGSKIFPLSSPIDYSRKLLDEVGRYSTLGTPEDTNALNDGIIDENTFLTSCNSIMDERERMLFYELDKFEEGILACVFDTTDKIHHMFWRFRDPGHPYYDERSAEKWSGAIADCYKRMDGIIGKVLGRIDSSTLLIICSDHGFSSFKRAVHLNTWLVKNRFMSLTGGSDSGGELFKDVDWNGTKAYALGFNSIYFNLKGREASGIMQKDEITQLQKEMISKLKSLSDNGQRVVKNVYTSREIFSGKELERAPDLVVGFEKGYRMSWQSAVGGAPGREVIENNMNKWSGDHCFDAEYVPGILLTSNKSILKNPSVLDIAPAILDFTDTR